MTRGARGWRHSPDARYSAAIRITFKARSERRAKNYGGMDAAEDAREPSERAARTRETITAQASYVRKGAQDRPIAQPDGGSHWGLASLVPRHPAGQGPPDRATRTRKTHPWGARFARPQPPDAAHRAARTMRRDPCSKRGLERV